MDTNTKVNIFNSDLDKNTLSGNVSFKKGKNRLTSIFDYKDEQIIFKQANTISIPFLKSLGFPVDLAKLN